MTATFLQSELSSLIQDSKKKYPDVKTAAEKSLAELKAIAVTSETQLAGDLIRRQNFVDPFVLACRSRYGKLAAGGVVCLQRLTASKAIPKERLGDVLDAFRDVANLGLDVQLKILQTLPSLLQLYSGELTGDLLASTLEVCGLLQGSKTAVISSTAAATFQQLVTSVFERVAEEDQLPNESPTSSDEHPEGMKFFQSSAHDASRLLHDLCALINNEEPTFVLIKGISPLFLLEVLSNIQTNHEVVLGRHAEMIEICQKTLFPSLLRLLASKITFAMTNRVLRMMYILIVRNMDTMQDECESALAYMTKLLEPDMQQQWKRILCMEVFRALCQEPALLPRMYETFDHQENRKNIVSNLMTSFVRIASEEPSLIGLGRQSTVPFRRGGPDDTQEGIALDPSGIGGSIGSVLSADSSVTGISGEWSTVKVPYMEQLDRKEASDIPNTYIYALVISCLVSVAEGVSKFVMPLSVPSRASMHQARSSTEENDLVQSAADTAELERPKSSGGGSLKYHRLVNPLTLRKHPKITAVRVCADLISNCWPAFLAACSTFMNAALDSGFYHALVRAFQKMTQVSGVLELTTPRDALLTCLGKAAVPLQLYTGPNFSFNDKSARNHADAAQTPTIAVQSPSTHMSRQSIDIGRPALSVRHLLCLRALLNLGIALGPTLSEESWFILLDTLRQVDVALNLLAKGPTQNNSQGISGDGDLEESRTNFGSETIAVQTAAKRMFESTKSYSDEGFRVMILALLRLAGYFGTDDRGDQLLSPTPSGSATFARRPSQLHQPSRSLSGLWRNSQSTEGDLSFVLAKISELARVNLRRFTLESSMDSSWNLIVSSLLKNIRSVDTVPQLRLQSASIVDLISIEVMKLVEEDDRDSNELDVIRTRCLRSFLDQIEASDGVETITSTDERIIDTEIHIRVFESLESILEHCGESLRNSWEIVFVLLRLTFNHSRTAEVQSFTESPQLPESQSLSPKVVQVAFRSLQLIVSDFLNGFPLKFLARVGEVLLLFGKQTEDLNISLTTTSFFWNVALMLQEKTTTIQFRKELSNSSLITDLEHGDEEMGAGALWMMLILRLKILCLDARQDVRNSSIRMTFKMLETFSSRLTPGAWNIYLVTVSFPTLRSYHTKITGPAGQPLNWEASYIQYLEATTDTAVRSLTAIVREECFSRTWDELLEILAGILKLDSLNIWSAVFQAISKFLSALRSLQITDPAYAISTLTLWLSHHPADAQAIGSSETTKPLSESNQEAFVQHATAFIEIFLLMKSTSDFEFVRSNLNEGRIMDTLRKTVFECSHPRYTSDVKRMSPEQEKVVLILSMLQELMQNKKSEFVNFLLEFVQAALPTEKSKKPTKAVQTGSGLQMPTFVAFSQQCIHLLNSTTTSFPAEEEIYHNYSLPATLNCLAAMVDSKCTSLPQNTNLPLWRSATQTAVNLINASVQHKTMTSISQSSDELSNFISASTNVMVAILSPGGLEASPTTSEPSKFLADEAFDMDHVQQLHASVITVLGRPQIPETFRQSYVIALFHASLVAKAWFFDIPKDLINSPLDGLSKVRMGTICDPIFPARRRICYTAIDAMLELVARPSSKDANANQFSEQRLRLAKTAAPYVLLRIAHAFKTFLADQRLRGLSPLPRLLQAELLSLVTKCLELQCNDAAFADLMGSMTLKSDGKTHLRLLFSLVLRVQEMWRKLPRLSGGGAWQENENGRAIEKGLAGWARVVAGVGPGTGDEMG